MWWWCDSVRARCVSVFVASLVVVVLTAAPARAQAPAPSRGDRALFGSGIGNAEQSLAAHANLGMLYYESLGVDPATSGRVPTKGAANRAGAGLSYQLNTNRIGATASWQSAGTYLPASQGKAPLWVVNHYASASASAGWDLSRHTHFRVGETASFQPSRFAELFPTDFQSAIDPTLVLGENPDENGHNLTLDSTAGLAHEFTRRFSMSADYGFSRRTLSTSDFSLLSHQASTAGHLAVTRNLSVRLGYRFMDTRVGEPGAPHYRSHSADIGLDYDRALTLRLTRHTTLDLAAGLGAVVDQHRSQHYRVNGTADLRHQMGRSWDTTLSYIRNMGFSEVFAEPILLDTVRGDLSGLITRRLAFHAGAAASRGTVGFVAAGHGIVRTSATSGVQLAVSRNIAMSVDYLYYRRDIEALVVIPAGFDRTPENQIISVSVNLWAPIFNRARRPNATR